ncbi:NAD-dependent epimerase/dehydratase family protein [Leptothoe sp. ISB3NOV94-8A]|uniref:NAD-dependent epimerase/dehydratase family protein n=1 Tax=Adonisia turfae TaxID=2950184 RepID=UPI00293966AE|nr:NAD-dependent epimerase/dehydratase family protein [Leptothoe sp. LEGE 181152]
MISFRNYVYPQVLNGLVLNGLKCAVLGGGGFIGTNLCQALVTAGANVKAFGRSANFPDALAGVDWTTGDFQDVSALAKLIQGCEIVFHLISNTSPATSNQDPALDLTVNTLGSLNLLNLCRYSDTVRKVIFISSGGTVYGIPKCLPISETAPTDPICAYGISKLAIEKYLALYNHLYGLDYLILRVSNPYGQFQTSRKNQGVVSAFLAKAIKGESLEIWGDGNVVRDYIFVDDVVTALIKAIDYSGEQRIFNIGSGVGKSINQIIDDIVLLLGRPLSRSYQSGRKVDVPANVLDITLAQKLMSFQPAIDWMAGLQKTLYWLECVKH